MCFSSVVLINESFEKFMQLSKFLKFSETLSTNSLGLTPLFFAAVSTFCPCSSVPVKKKTSYSSRRLNLAITSHASVVYAWPI